MKSVTSVQMGAGRVTEGRSGLLWDEEYLEKGSSKVFIYTTLDSLDSTMMKLLNLSIPPIGRSRDY